MSPQCQKTIFGALKSINHATMDAQKDPGQDGYGASGFEEDAFAMALDYFRGDYLRKGTYINSGTYDQRTDYYNGLVKSERWQINHANAAPSTGKQWMYNYTYDEHNWLTSATFGEFDHAEGVNRAEGENSFDIFPAFTPDSKEQYKVWNLSYDDNGNLQTLNRNMNERLVFGNTQVKMDEFTYRYKSGTNQLVHLNDNVTTSSFETDLKDQGTWDEETPANWNYEYDELGRMVANNDISEPRYFEYDATGLVTAVYDHSLKTDEDLLVKFVYDENGMRVKKTDYNSGSTPLKHTWYIRDAAGNVLAVYEQEDPTGTGTVDIEEKHIYGSGRIGQYNMIGKYYYELTDHRGNVRAVVSHNGVDLVWESYQDYYPFGSEMWGSAHSYNAGTYRYAYQGQELDGETGYEAFELRQWDGRLGRWMSVDPYQEFASPYLGMGNNPVIFSDPDGGSIFGGGGHDINWARRIGGGSNWIRVASLAGTVLSATAQAAMDSQSDDPGPVIWSGDLGNNKIRRFIKGLFKPRGGLIGKGRYRGPHTEVRNRTFRLRIKFININYEKWETAEKRSGRGNFNRTIETEGRIRYKAEYRWWSQGTFRIRWAGGRPDTFFNWGILYGRGGRGRRGSRGASQNVVNLQLRPNSPNGKWKYRFQERVRKTIRIPIIYVTFD